MLKYLLSHIITDLCPDSVELPWYLHVLLGPVQVDSHPCSEIAHLQNSKLGSVNVKVYL